MCLGCITENTHFPNYEYLHIGPRGVSNTQQHGFFINHQWKRAFLFPREQKIPWNDNLYTLNTDWLNQQFFLDICPTSILGKVWPIYWVKRTNFMVDVTNILIKFLTQYCTGTHQTYWLIKPIRFWSVIRTKDVSKPLKIPSASPFQRHINQNFSYGLGKNSIIFLWITYYAGALKSGIKILNNKASLETLIGLWRRTKNAQ